MDDLVSKMLLESLLHMWIVYFLPYVEFCSSSFSSTNMETSRNAPVLCFSGGRPTFIYFFNELSSCSWIAGICFMVLKLALHTL